MIIQAYLTISDNGALKVTKGRPYLSNNEIAIILNIDIPNVFFKRLMPTVNISIPEEAVLSPDAEVAINLAAVEVSDKLRLDFNDVQDGLRKMIEDKKKDVE